MFISAVNWVTFVRMAGGMKRRVEESDEEDLGDHSLKLFKDIGYYSYDL